MPRVGLLWRAEWDPPEADRSIIESCKLREVFRAFQALGVAARPVVYSDDKVDDVKAQLLGLEGVLVWVNPIEQGLDRAKLDPLLCEVADAGVWVSAHPDVILQDGDEAGARGHQADELGHRHEAPSDCSGPAT